MVTRDGLMNVRAIQMRAGHIPGGKDIPLKLRHVIGRMMPLNLLPAVVDFSARKGNSARLSLVTRDVRNQIRSPDIQRTFA